MLNITTKNDFEIFVKNTFENFNFDNTEYFNKLWLYFINNFKSKNARKAYNICVKFFKENRNTKHGSLISTDYWISMGYSMEYAINKVSELQRKRSMLTEEYWSDKGYSDIDAKNKIKELQSINSVKRFNKYNKDELRKQSVWCKDYWIEKGYSFDEAISKCHEYNFGCREFYKSDNDYEVAKKYMSDYRKNVIKNNPDKYIKFFTSSPLTVSNEEILFFNDIENSLIHHKQFVINVSKDKTTDDKVFIYDGYYKEDNILILIEYDGLYWHNESWDDLKDSITFNIRDDISGIIRVSDAYYKKHKSIIKNIVNDGITEIKNRKHRRIKFY